MTMDVVTTTEAVEGMIGEVRLVASPMEMACAH
jgi:hypothetical protein